MRIGEENEHEQGHGHLGGEQPVREREGRRQVTSIEEREIDICLSVQWRESRSDDTDAMFMPRYPERHKHPRRTHPQSD